MPRRPPDQDPPPTSAVQRAVVDGSNIATEGRSLPSLVQLDEAVRAFQAEYHPDEVIVVVDASFEHRIDESERATYREAEAAGEIVSPPAGAIGRGDGFLLQIADRIGATVLSNDSFQEFHGDYEWLFEDGRLIGGKPVPGVGWIFTPRAPVRGPKSRMATRQASRRPARPAPAEPVAEAIAEASADVLEPEGGAPVPRRRRRVLGSGVSASSVATSMAAFTAFFTLAGSATFLAFLAFCTETRLRGPRTGDRGVKIHPIPGTGTPPMRRSGSKSQS